MGWGDSELNCWGSQGSRTRVILVLREYIRDAPAVLLVLPPFDDTGSMGSPLRQMVSPPGSMVPPLGNCLSFPCGE